MFTCSRCGRSYDQRPDWNVILEAGQVTGYLCPDDQTPGENTEAELNAAVLDYSTDAFGRITGTAKR